jgi:hypothetical protein
VLSIPTFARAQECADGRVNTPETAGRCCWPGQSWSDQLGRCSGPPTCPAGRSASGDDCVLAGGENVMAQQPPPGYQAQQPPPGYENQPPPGYGTPGYQPVYGAQPVGQPRQVQRPRMGLAIMGIVMFAVSWVVPTVIGLSIAPEDGISDDFYFMAVPLAGPFIMTGLVENSWPIAFFVLDGILQLAGLTALILGFTLKSTVTVYSENEDEQKFAIMPWVAPGSGGAAGLTVMQRF